MARSFYPPLALSLYRMYSLNKMDHRRWIRLFRPTKGLNPHLIFTNHNMMIIRYISWDMMKYVIFGRDMIISAKVLRHMLLQYPSPLSPKSQIENEEKVVHIFFWHLSTVQAPQGAVHLVHLRRQLLDRILLHYKGKWHQHIFIIIILMIIIINNMMNSTSSYTGRHLRVPAFWRICSQRYQHTLHYQIIIKILLTISNIILYFHSFIVV